MRAVDLDSPVALPGAYLGAAGQDHAVPPRPERDRRHRRLFLAPAGEGRPVDGKRSEEHTSELQSLMRHASAVFCLKTNTNIVKSKQQKTSDNQNTRNKSSDRQNIKD